MANLMNIAWRIFRRNTAGSRPVNAAARRKAFSIALKSAWMTVRFERDALAKASLAAAEQMVSDMRLQGTN